MQELSNIIIENKNLIYKMINFFPEYQDKEDLFQAGCKGMIEAYQKYNPDKAKFTTYAYPYILGEMRKVVRESKGIKISKDIITLKNKINNLKEKLFQKMHRQPTTQELSEYLQIPEYYIIEALNSDINIKSLEENIYDSNMIFEEVISDKNTDIDTLLYLKSELEALEEPEKTIMIERYYNDLTQTQTADLLGLSQVEVSRKEKKVLTKLRQYNWQKNPNYL